MMTAKNKNHIENRLRSRIQVAQKWLAGFLNRHFNKLSNNIQKMVLLFFGLAAGSACVFLIAQSLWGEGNHTTFHINKITVPENTPVPMNWNPEQDYREIIRYKQLLDSLKVYDKSIYDSIVARHPGLPDSVNQLLNAMERQHNLSRKERIGIGTSTH